MHNHPYDELIRKTKGIFKDEIWIVHHPLDLRDKFQYKNVKDNIFRPMQRHEYEMLLSGGVTLIHYED